MSHPRRIPLSARLLIVAAAALAAALAVVPVAAAQSKVGPRTATSSPLATGFGWQKFRVGVQIKSGAWVPAGTATAGSQVHIVETDNGGTQIRETTCTTEADTIEAGSTESYCTFDTADVQETHAATADLVDYYVAAPGDTVQLNQVSAEPNLVVDPLSQTKDPVDNGCASPTDPCSDTGPVTFNDNGTPPMASDDSATTREPNSVDIDVLANDNPPDGAPRTLSVVEHPGHGTAQPINQTPAVRQQAATPNSAQFRYTPNTGFVGSDSFVYRLSTANGSATATVHITVTAAPAPSSSTPPPTASSSNDTAGASTSAPSGAPSLASTGVAAGRLTGLAAGLLVVGGAATVAGRRRRRGGHVS
jgi:hypothetical protein